MKLHLIYNPNRGGAEVRVHKAGCRGIQRDLRGSTSSDVFDAASQAEAVTERWGGFINEGSMTAADAPGYTDPLPCPHGLPEAGQS
jgi:hypothetical protein